jgi:hypothetical protein
VAIVLDAFYPRLRWPLPELASFIALARVFLDPTTGKRRQARRHREQDDDLT